MRITLSIQYVIAFLALTILCGTSHEFAHHFVAAIGCGGFGEKTFNSFTLAKGCETNVWAVQSSAWAGPLLTFGLMWLGVRRLASADPAQRQLGFALIFANFPINRIVFAFLHFNDEQFAMAKILGHTPLAYWSANLIVCLLAVPPLILALLAIENRPRILWFLGFLLLPFAFVVIFAGFFLENWLLLDRKVLAGSFLGVPMLIYLVEILATVIYLANRHAIARPRHAKT